MAIFICLLHPILLGCPLALMLYAAETEQRFTPPGRSFMLPPLFAALADGP